MASIFTTPPPPKPPGPKHPLFTSNFFSTKSFGPGHVVGAAALVFGIVGMTKFAIARGKENAERYRRQTQPPQRSDELAQAGNERGQYGRRP